MVDDIDVPTAVAMGWQNNSVAIALGPDRHSVLTPITSLPLARAAAEAVERSLHKRFPEISPSVLRMTRSVFEELGANVVDHTGAPETGFGWADVQLTSRRLHLAFADSGIGFSSSLQRNPELAGRVADDAEALQLALTPRVSGTGPSRKNMGWGLKTLVDLSDLLDGDLHIASGSAMLLRRTRAGQRTNAIRAIPPWQGAWICLEARLG